MERLTNKKEADAQRKAYVMRLKQGYPRNIPEERFLRLAAYEDTGLEPQEVVKMCGEVKTAYDESGIPYAAEYTGYEAQHITELAQTEQDGRLVVLPCRAGDTVYKIFCNEIVPALIEKVEINAFTNPKIWVQIGTDFTSSQEYRFDLSCGKDFYLTREEAEAAMGGGSDNET